MKLVNRLLKNAALLIKRSNLLLVSACFSLSTSVSFAEDYGDRQDNEQVDFNEVEQYQFSDAELQQMLAPIALYPDSILTHVLIASTYPLEIVQAARWLKNNEQLSEDEISEQIESQDWDPSVKALVPFPRLLDRLNEDLDWTQKLGDAFLQDETSVLENIQALRQKADEVGNLAQMENVNISREDDNIVIQPIRERVVYIPYYDTRVVYGDWYWHHYQPVYWQWSWHNHYALHHHHRHIYKPHHGLYSWHPAVHIGNHYAYSYFNWHSRFLIVNHYGRHKHVNRPAARWVHNPRHRHGVAYHNKRLGQKYKANYVANRYQQGSKIRHLEVKNPLVSGRVQQNIKSQRHLQLKNQLQRNNLKPAINVKPANSSPARIYRTPKANQTLIKRQNADRGSIQPRNSEQDSANDTAPTNERVRNNHRANDSRASNNYPKPRQSIQPVRRSHQINRSAGGKDKKPTRSRSKKDD